MTYIYPFPSKIASSSLDLAATLISLEDWALVNVVGQDTNSYLQGQLTSDMNALTPERQTLAGHCDAKGKLWSSLRLFQRGDGLSYIERNSVKERQITELKKYAVFAKITISADDNSVLLGLAGRQAREHLQTLFAELPDQQRQTVQQGATTLLFIPLPSERFIIITDHRGAEHIFNQLLTKVGLNDSRQWLALDIEAGLPIIDLPVIQQFPPQSFNLQALGAISFTKGCYTGQEMVARAKYRGANKRALYWLAGTAHQQPLVGDELELQIGDNWRRTGTVLAAVTLTDDVLDNTLWVQAVLNNDLDANSQFRIREDEDSQLTLQPLPYSLAESE